MLTTAGGLTELARPTPGSGPDSLTVGPDGNLWVTELGGNRIARVTTAGAITEFPVPTPGRLTCNIVAGPDGNLWFTECLGNRIGRVILPAQIAEIPTLSSWMLGTFALLLLATGWVLMRNRAIS